MKPVRQSIGGLGNLMFKQAFLMGKMLDGEINDVYVQNTSAWKKYAPLVKATFGEGIPPRKDVVAVHIRRGDYLNASHFYTSLTDSDYYKKALALFPNDKFLVFCADRQNQEQDYHDKWFASSFMNEQLGANGRFTIHISGEDETDDMNAMASCKSIIMANSSFSWWAAYLGYHEKVVCPKDWFCDGVQRIELLPEWIQI